MRRAVGRNQARDLGTLGTLEMRRGVTVRGLEGGAAEWFRARSVGCGSRNRLDFVAWSGGGCDFDRGGAERGLRKV